MNARFVARMAWREGRATRRRLWLLTGAVAAGVAALVAVNSFAANLRAAVTTEARALLGADLALSSRRPMPDRVEALLDTLRTPAAQGAEGQVARMVSFSGMAYVPRTAGVRLVQVAAVGPGYPFYGEIRTDPPGAWDALQDGGRVLVDPSLLAALAANLGDSLALGDSRFVIAGAIISQPGAVAAATAFSPRIFIAERDLEATNLLRFGSRAEYEAFVRLPDPGAANALSDRYRPVLRPERVRIRSVEENRDDLSEALTQLGNYLGLVALVALLLGGLGVASAVHVFIRQKLDTIAVLRCLGATWGRVFTVYLLQAAAMGLVGSVAGAGLGVALQQVLPALLQDLLPVNVRVRVSAGAVLLGIGLGLWVTLVFALRPLLAIRDVSPLRTLRRDVEPAPPRREPLRWLANIALAASVLGLAVVQAGNLSDGIGFTGGIGAALLVLWLASLALIKAVRRWFPSRWPYVWRQGLANLFRPANQTVTVVISLGFGAFLLSTVLLVQHNLLRDLRSTVPGLRPNLVFFDIQADQKEGVIETIRAAGVEPQPPVALVPMRIAAVKGQQVPAATGTDVGGQGGGQEGGQASGQGGGPEGGREGGQQGGQGGAGGGPGGWAVRREYRSTYRDTVVASERVVQGSWWEGPATDPAAPVDVSLEEEIASELGVSVGDEIVWNVQGVQVPSRVANLREVDWARFEPNFFAVFRGGRLDRAPQTFATLVRLDEPTQRGALQRRIAERYPNVTSVDLGTVQVAVEGILDRVVLAVRFMAAFSLATGAIVLIGAIATTRFQRLREAVLLKTLGATRAQVFRVVLAEYLALGGLASGMAVLLSIAAGWALARHVFEAPRFALPAPSVAGLAAVVVTLTVVIGLWNSADILRKPPLEALRNE